MEKLYERQSYLKECKAKVVECIEDNEKVYIKLDRSIFFPEEGGQYADTGMLEILDDAGNSTGDVVNLLDGQIKDGDIVYTVSKRIESKTTVLCKLDWHKRFGRMQNHSGEHILSGLIHNKFGFNNIGFHLSDDDVVTLVADGIISKDEATVLEKEVNEIIYRNLPIIDSYPTKEELQSINYRSKKEIEGQVRLITIGEDDEVIDICACCAPHVAKTGEIGIVKITGVMKFKGGTQISILCGRRALEYINHNLNTLNQLANIFTTNADNVPSIVENLKNENMDLTAKLSEYKEKAVIEYINNNPDKNCVFVNEQLSATNMKNIFNALVENRQGYVGVFMGDDKEGYRYNAGGKDLDAKILANIMREKLDAKGGGSSEMIQGKVASSQNIIDEFWCNIS